MEAKAVHRDQSHSDICPTISEYPRDRRHPFLSDTANDREISRPPDSRKFRSHLTVPGFRDEVLSVGTEP